MDPWPTDIGRTNGFRFCRFRAPPRIWGTHSAGLGEKRTWRKSRREAQRCRDRSGGTRGYRNKEARKMSCESVRRWRPGALLSVTLLLTAALWLPAASTATAATPTTFSGQATALKGDLLGLRPLVSIDCKDSAAAKNSTICLAA